MTGSAHAQIQPPWPPPEGQWHGPHNWNNHPTHPQINPIHVGLIPRGLHKGQVVFLSWATAGWGILDPEKDGPTQPPAPQFHGTWPLPDGRMPCSGHAWTADGRWFVAGGQEGNPAYNGAWIYDPDSRSLGSPNAQGDWYPQKPMQKARYYPTVILTGVDHPEGELIVAGGSLETGPVSNPTFQHDYETFRPGIRHWPPDDPTNPLNPANIGEWQTHSPGQYIYAGPQRTSPNEAHFNFYPRLFWLPDGRMVLAAIEELSVRAQHPVTAEGQWWELGVRTIPGPRWYGAAVLYPNLGPNLTSTVMNIGGAKVVAGSPPVHVAVDNVEWAQVASGVFDYWPLGHRWTYHGSPNPPVTAERKPPKLNVPRSECNAVILPTSEILVLHNNHTTHPDFKKAELLSGGVWKLMAEEVSVRDHHATAILLRSGRVLSAGGNTRSKDFEVYSPPYVFENRPAWVTYPASMLRGTTHTASISLPAGTSVGKIVLIRPASLTHHADMDQQYVQLPIVAASESSVTFKAPDNPPDGRPGVTARLGFWMLFLVTNTGVPSVAEFVLLF